METQTQEAPAKAAFKLSAPRKAVKKGIGANDLWILAGLPKAGKTTLAASIPGMVMLELERGGADRVDGWVQEIPDLTTFRAALKAAVEEPEAKCIVVDSLDVLSDWFEADVAAQFGIEEIGSAEKGVNGFEVWKELRLRFENLIKYMRTANKMIVFVAHSREPKFSNEGKVIMTAGIQIPGKLGSYIAGQVDAIGHVYKSQIGSSTKFYISFQGGPLGVFGSRIAELEDKTIELPKENQWSAVVNACNAVHTNGNGAEAQAVSKNGKKGGK